MVLAAVNDRYNSSFFLVGIDQMPNLVATLSPLHDIGRLRLMSDTQKRVGLEIASLRSIRGLGLSSHTQKRVGFKVVSLRSIRGLGLSSHV
jgi:hypothetical protein